VVIELIGGIEPARTIQLAALAPASRGDATSSSSRSTAPSCCRPPKTRRLSAVRGKRGRRRAGDQGAARVARRGAHHRRHGIVNARQLHPFGHGAERAEYAPTLVRAQELATPKPIHRRRDRQDAAAKMAILSSIAFHSRVTLSDVEHQGIESITTST